MNLDQFISTLLDGKKSKMKITDQLYKIPTIDKNGDNTTFDHINPGFIQYADLLHISS